MVCLDDFFFRGTIGCVVCLIAAESSFPFSAMPHNEQNFDVATPFLQSPPRSFAAIGFYVDGARPPPCSQLASLVQVALAQSRRDLGIGTLVLSIGFLTNFLVVRTVNNFNTTEQFAFNEPGE